MGAMADNYPGKPQSQPSPEPDPWATMPRQNLTPPGDESPFARPAANPWQPPEPVEQAEPTAVQPPVEPAQPENPYDTSPWGSEPTSQLPPFPGSTPPPPPPAAPSAASFPSAPAPEAQQYPAPYAASGPAWAPGSAGPGVPQHRDANPLMALFDFSFTKFATPGLVKIVYILQVVGAVGAWLLWLLAAFGASRFDGGAAVGLLVLLVGWIPVLLSIAFTRFVLEGIVALIRIHDRVTEMAERDKAS